MLAYGCGGGRYIYTLYIYIGRVCRPCGSGEVEDQYHFSYVTSELELYRQTPSLCLTSPNSDVEFILCHMVRWYVSG